MGKIHDSKLSKQDMLVVQVVSTVQPNKRRISLIHVFLKVYAAYNFDA